MEGSYSVSTNNRFAFFMDEEDDPGDMVIQTESKSPKTTTEVSPAQKKTENVPTKGKDQKPVVQGKKVPGESTGGKRREVQFNERNQQKSNDNRPPRDNRRQPFTNGGGPNRSGEGEPRTFRQNRGRGRLPSKEKEGGDRSEGGGGSSGVDDASQRDNRSRPRRGERNYRDNRERTDREEGGERGGFRSNRPRGGFRGGKREFERRSGNDKSSVKPVDKKEGAGSHNWGTSKDDLNTSAGDEWPSDEVEVPTLPKTETTEDNNTGEDPPVELDTEAPPTTEKEVEEITLTLDEYKAEQEKKRFVPAFKERKPGENEDSTRWKDTFVYERIDGELVPGTREVVEKYKSSGRVKTALESSFFFKDTSRFGRGGGPGGKRGERRQFDDRQDDREQRPPRRSEGGERRPRRFDDEGGERRPRRFDGEGGERKPRRFDGEGGERKPRRFDDEGGERRPRRFDDEGGERKPRKFDDEGGERRPRRFDDDRRRGGGRTQGRVNNFNVEDEKDFPSLGTVSA